MADKKRLIDAKEFWNRLSHVVYDVFTVHEKDGQLTNTASVGYYTETIQEVLKQTKTVDAVEVVHGRWIYHECVSSHDGAISGYSCSECGAFVNEEIFDMDEFHKDFCGHCGAKMDGERKDNA